MDPYAAYRISQRMTRGMTVAQACSLETPPVMAGEFELAARTRRDIQHAVARGEADYIEESLAAIERGGDDAPGRKWILEKAKAEQFGSKQRVEVRSTSVIAHLSSDLCRQLSDRMKELDEKPVKVVQTPSDSQGVPTALMKVTEPSVE